MKRRLEKEPPTFAEVEDRYLGGHRGTGAGSGGRAARLYRKHVQHHRQEMLDGPIPFLDENTVEVIMESWSTSDLFRVLPSDRPGAKLPRQPTEDPPVIVRDRGIDSLIDGGRRISKWVRTRPDEDHEVVVLAVHEDKPIPHE